MSMFGFYFVRSLLFEAGWPRKQGILRGRAFDTIIVDAVINEMVDWAAALGAGCPTLALQAIAEVYRDRDWKGAEAPNIIAFVERAQDDWNRSASIAPREVVAPIRVGESFGKSMSTKDFMDVRLTVVLEQSFVLALLWGLSNPDRFAEWYGSNVKENEGLLSFAGKVGLDVAAPPAIHKFFEHSETMFRDYERELGPLSLVPAKLISDARSLGWKVDENIPSRALRFKPRNTSMACRSR